MNNLLSILLAVFLLLGGPAGRTPGTSGNGSPWPSPTTGASYESFDPVQELPSASQLPYRNLSVLAGRTIVVDAGHGGDNPGDHGPSGQQKPTTSWLRPAISRPNWKGQGRG